MELTVKDRIIKYLEYKQINRSEFSRQIGVSATYIGSMRESIHPDKLKCIAVKFPDLNIEWLLTGNGTMLKENNESLQEKELIYEKRRKGIDLDEGGNINPKNSDAMNQLILELTNNLAEANKKIGRLEHENEQLKEQLRETDTVPQKRGVG